MAFLNCIGIDCVAWNTEKRKQHTKRNYYTKKSFHLYASSHKNFITVYRTIYGFKIPQSSKRHVWGCKNSGCKFVASKSILFVVLGLAELQHFNLLPLTFYSCDYSCFGYQYIGFPSLLHLNLFILLIYFLYVCKN